MIIANWKCNGSKKMIHHWLNQYKNSIIPSDKYVGVAPPYLYTENFLNSSIEHNLGFKLGVQDINSSSGAITGAISLDMVKDMNCQFIILGHSERRIFFKESNLKIEKKLDIIDNNIDTILCVGESADENKNGETQTILREQLSVIDGKDIASSLTIAYEPVWAIGTGNTPTSQEINDIHIFIKDVVQSITNNNIVPKVIYGGSVTESNSEVFFNEEFIDGALIGGASLDGEGFANIVNNFNGYEK